jgi:hypothetical protein
MNIYSFMNELAAREVSIRSLYFVKVSGATAGERRAAGKSAAAKALGDAGRSTDVDGEVRIQVNTAHVCVFPGHGGASTMASEATYHG